MNEIEQLKKDIHGLEERNRWQADRIRELEDRSVREVARRRFGMAWSAYRFQQSETWTKLEWTWFPYGLRWTLRWTACAVLGHKGGGTFGYWRCNRCLTDCS